jgi:membrane-bound inhibitor of C-type lysozyme
MRTPTTLVRTSIVALATLTMAACGTTPATRDAWINYTCTDGRSLQANYPDTATAVIKLQGETHILRIAVSGSGARYTGEGLQWWTKGMHDGMLAPLASGESIASAAGTACHAD